MESGDRRARVEDIDRMARALEDRLAEMAIAEGAVVALAAPNGPGFLAGLLAIRRRRCAALLYDWRTPAAEKQRIARVLRFAAFLRCGRVWPGGPGDFTLGPAAGEPLLLSPEVAVVKLTSGSTGQPRGIMTSSAALVADDAALATTMDLQADERILATLPMSHSYGLSSVVMPALMRRSLLVVAAGGGGPLDPLVTAVERDVTFFPTVPSFLEALVKMAQPPRLPGSLRRVISAGEPLQPATAEAFRRVYGRPVHVFYGASECGGIAFDRVGDAGERGTVGTPVDGVEITLNPVEGATEAETGPATVVVRSPAVADGYIPDPAASLANGCFRTQDLAVLQDGELVLQGRRDDLINVRGKKVNPREVETVLGQLDGVEEAVVLGVTRPGREETVVRSFLVCPAGEVTRASVQDWCRRHLAHHKIPRSIVWLDEMPRTERGKLDRAALLRMEPSGRPGPRSVKTTSHHG